MSNRMRSWMLRALHGWGWAIAVDQLSNGAIETSLSPHYPQLQHHINATDAVWGLVLSGIPIGLLLGSQLGPLIAGGLQIRWAAHRPHVLRVLPVAGSRAALGIGGLLFFVAPALTGLCPTWPLAWLTLLAAGVGNGVFDVGWNLQATSYEQRAAEDSWRRQANLWLQALFSLGSLLGAGSGWLALRLGWTASWHMAVTAAVTVGLMVATLRGLPAAPERDLPPTPRATSEPTQRAGRHPDGWLTFGVMCIVAFFAALPLGAVYAWSTPYLLGAGAGPATAALGLVAYTLAEALGRVTAASTAILRSDQRRTVRLGGLVALLGALGIVTATSPVLIIAGFALLAAGLGPAVPIVQSAASRLTSDRHRTLRAGLLIGAGYGGGVLGQPLVGPIAQATSLRLALWLLPLAVLVVTSLAFIVPGRDHSRALRPASAPPGPEAPKFEGDPIMFPNRTARHTPAAEPQEAEPPRVELAILPVTIDLTGELSVWLSSPGAGRPSVIRIDHSASQPPEHAARRHLVLAEGLYADEARRLGAPLLVGTTSVTPIIVTLLDVMPATRGGRLRRLRLAEALEALEALEAVDQGPIDPVTEVLVRRLERVSPDEVSPAGDPGRSTATDIAVIATHRDASDQLWVLLDTAGDGPHVVRDFDDGSLSPKTCLAKQTGLFPDAVTTLGGPLDDAGPTVAGYAVTVFDQATAAIRARGGRELSWMPLADALAAADGPGPDGPPCDAVTAALLGRLHRRELTRHR
jgi:MFS family permease